MLEHLQRDDGAYQVINRTVWAIEKMKQDTAPHILETQKAVDKQAFKSITVEKCLYIQTISNQLATVSTKLS